MRLSFLLFFFQAEDGIRDHCVTGVQTWDGASAGAATGPELALEAGTVRGLCQGTGGCVAYMVEALAEPRGHASRFSNQPCVYGSSSSAGTFPLRLHDLERLVRQIVNLVVR